jgi:hypothetical protein
MNGMKNANDPVARNTLEGRGYRAFLVDLALQGTIAPLHTIRHPGQDSNRCWPAMKVSWHRLLTYTFGTLGTCRDKVGCLASGKCQSIVPKLDEKTSRKPESDISTAKFEPRIVVTEILPP